MNKLNIINKLRDTIEQHWYKTSNLLLVMLLYPFSLVYWAVINIRYKLFDLNILKRQKIRVPVIVIGNISVGGVGKTPLTKYLAQQLTSRGYSVGIILRGYKSQATASQIVTLQHTSMEVGDEALVHVQAGFNVVIGKDRVANAQLLLEKYPQTQLILSDDGMQHYYLSRDMEICVIDSTRVFGNQHLLPYGPLREPLSRLKRVSAIVVNGLDNQMQLSQILAPYQHKVYNQHLQFIDFYNPQTKQHLCVKDLKDTKVCVISAIGNPQRFYDYLQQLGLTIALTKTFPNHYHYQLADIVSNSSYEIIITTEKDYTKIAQFCLNNVWIARIDVELNNCCDAQETLLKRICDVAKLA